MADLRLLGYVGSELGREQMKQAAEEQRLERPDAGRIAGPRRWLGLGRVRLAISPKAKRLSLSASKTPGSIEGRTALVAAGPRRSSPTLDTPLPADPGTAREAGGQDGGARAQGAAQDRPLPSGNAFREHARAVARCASDPAYPAAACVTAVVLAAESLAALGLGQAGAGDDLRANVVVLFRQGRLTARDMDPSDFQALQSALAAIGMDKLRDTLVHVQAYGVQAGAALAEIGGGQDLQAVLKLLEGMTHHQAGIDAAHGRSPQAVLDGVVKEMDTARLEHLAHRFDGAQMHTLEAALWHIGYRLQNEAGPHAARGDHIMDLAAQLQGVRVAMNAALEARGSRRAADRNMPEALPPLDGAVAEAVATIIGLVVADGALLVIHDGYVHCPAPARPAAATVSPQPVAAQVPLKPSAASSEPIEPVGPAAWPVRAWRVLTNPGRSMARAKGASLRAWRSAQVFRFRHDTKLRKSVGKRVAHELRKLSRPYAGKAALASAADALSDTMRYMDLKKEDSLGIFEVHVEQQLKQLSSAQLMAMLANISHARALSANELYLLRNDRESVQKERAGLSAKRRLDLDLELQKTFAHDSFVGALLGKLEAELGLRSAVAMKPLLARARQLFLTPADDQAAQRATIISSLAAWVKLDKLTLPEVSEFFSAFKNETLLELPLANDLDMSPRAQVLRAGAGVLQKRRRQAEASLRTLILHVQQAPRDAMSGELRDPQGLVEAIVLATARLGELKQAYGDSFMEGEAGLRKSLALGARQLAPQGFPFGAIHDASLLKALARALGEVGFRDPAVVEELDARLEAIAALEILHMEADREKAEADVNPKLRRSVKLRKDARTDAPFGALSAQGVALRPTFQKAVADVVRAVGESDGVRAVEDTVNASYARAMQVARALLAPGVRDFQDQALEREAFALALTSNALRVDGKAIDVSLIEALLSRLHEQEVRAIGLQFAATASAATGLSQAPLFGHVARVVLAGSSAISLIRGLTSQQGAVTKLSEERLLLAYTRLETFDRVNAENRTHKRFTDEIALAGIELNTWLSMAIAERRLSLSDMSLQTFDRLQAAVRDSRFSTRTVREAFDQDAKRRRETAEKEFRDAAKAAFALGTAVETVAALEAAQLFRVAPQTRQKVLAAVLGTSLEDVRERAQEPALGDAIRGLEFVAGQVTDKGYAELGERLRERVQDLQLWQATFATPVAPQAAESQGRPLHLQSLAPMLEREFGIRLSGTSIRVVNGRAPQHVQATILANLRRIEEAAQSQPLPDINSRQLVGDLERRALIWLLDDGRDIALVNRSPLAENLSAQDRAAEQRRRATEAVRRLDYITDSNPVALRALLALTNGSALAPLETISIAPTLAGGMPGGTAGALLGDLRDTYVVEMDGRGGFIVRCSGRIDDASHLIPSAPSAGMKGRAPIALAFGRASLDYTVTISADGKLGTLGDEELMFDAEVAALPESRAGS